MNKHETSRKLKVPLNKILKLKVYNTLGSHKLAKHGTLGIRFALWAPNAHSVSVVGNFNSWDSSQHIMKRNKKLNVWTLFIPNLMEDELYKYEITTYEGKKLLKSDPYAFYSELRPNTATKIINLKGYPRMMKSTI
jgi:1,4-alpha-glucan branching enzyme